MDGYEEILLAISKAVPEARSHLAQSAELCGKKKARKLAFGFAKLHEARGLNANPILFKPEDLKEVQKFLRSNRGLVKRQDLHQFDESEDAPLIRTGLSNQCCGTHHPRHSIFAS